MYAGPNTQIIKKTKNKNACMYIHFAIFISDISKTRNDLLLNYQSFLLLQLVEWCESISWICLSKYNRSNIVELHGEILRFTIHIVICMQELR